MNDDAIDLRLKKNQQLLDFLTWKEAQIGPNKGLPHKSRNSNHLKNIIDHLLHSESVATVFLCPTTTDGRRVIGGMFMHIFWVWA